MKKILILVRHGESIGNTENMLMGCRIGSELSEKGKAQVKSTSDFLKKNYPWISKIYSSPVGRAYQTASMIANEYSTEPIIEETIREIDFGDMTGRKLNEIPKEIDDAYLANPYEFAHTNGESLKDVFTRVKPFVEGILMDNENIIIVSHDNVIKCIIGHLKGLSREICDLKISYASIIVYEVTENGAYCMEFNKKT